MSDIERIIRPAQDGAIRPAAVQGYQAPPATPDDNTITWGSSGSNIFQVSAHVSQTIDNPWPKSDETQRTYDLVRVKNPDDTDQHVDVEVMTEYQARNKIDKSRITLRYGAQEGSANVEVLSRKNIRKSPTSP